MAALGRQKDWGGAWVDGVILALVGGGLLLLLHCYGTAVLPFVPDETLFLQPARNLAEGRGMGTPALDDLLPGIAQRTYWQPPVYFLALAAWGKLVGFEVVAARWFSRLCAVGVLALVWLLARRWGVGRWLALLGALWTGLDLAFQYDANTARMDALSAFWLLACLLAFTRHQHSGQCELAAVAGLFGALATLTHFITLPAVVTLGAVLSWRRRWRALAWFAFPIAAGWFLWLVYAAQDWQGWVGQLVAQFARKGENAQRALGVWLLFPHSFTPSWGVFATNAIPFGWCVLLAATLVGVRCRAAPLALWQVGVLAAAYFAAAAGGEFWYAGWWTPFGYLLLSCWLHALGTRGRGSIGVGLLCVALVGWQVAGVARTLMGVPRLRGDIARFFAEVPTVLPRGATVLLHSVPDPFPVLQRVRPDLKLVQLSPTPMQPGALARNLQQAHALVGITHWVRGKPGAVLPPAQRAWRFRAPAGTWVVRLHYFHRPAKPMVGATEP